MFNPYFRISVDEALTHPFFKKVKKAEKESAAAHEIQIEFEKEHLDRKKLRQLFMEEVKFYKEMNAKAGTAWVIAMQTSITSFEWCLDYNLKPKFLTSIVNNIYIFENFNIICQ